MYEANITSAHRAASRLKLVEFTLPGESEPRVCAALWQHGGEVHLLAPVLRQGGTASLLDSVLGWLDAACFAARWPKQVSAACAANPEWHLRCAPFDGSDRSLQALGELIRACRGAGPQT